MESQQADNKKRQEEDAKLKVIPHLKNINQDPIMSGKIKCLMKNGHNSIGKKDPSGADVSVLLTGAGIQFNHAIINYDPETRQSVI